MRADETNYKHKLMLALKQRRENGICFEIISEDLRI